MAFTIKVFEKDDYLFSLLKMRLETMFPDAYIINAIEDPGRSDCLDFSEFTKIIYDPRNIDMSDFKDAVLVNTPDTSDLAKINQLEAELLDLIKERSIICKASK